MAGDRIHHRLRRGVRQVEDRQPSVRQHDTPASVVAARLPVALTIGTPMPQRVVDPSQRRSVGVPQLPDDTGDTTHRITTLRKVRRMSGRSQRAIRGHRARARGSIGPLGSGTRSGGAALPRQQHPGVIVAQEAPEFGAVVARLALRCGLEPAPQHGETSERIRLLTDASQRARRHVEKPSPHKVLTVSVPHPPYIDTLLTRPHGPQMYEPQLGVVPAARDPTVHATLVAIDTVPHDLTNKSANAFKAGSAVKLRHAERGVIAVSFVDQAALFLDVGLAATGCNAGILVHALDEDLEI